MRIVLGVCVALVLAVAPVLAEPRFEYRGDAPGVTTYDDFAERTLQPKASAYAALGTNTLATFECTREVRGTKSCFDDGGPLVHYYFVDNVLSEVLIVYNVQQADSVLDLLKTKYGRATGVQGMVFQNDVGANVPFHRYLWKQGGRVIAFDEISNRLDLCQLDIYDAHLLAVAKKRINDVSI